jgi:hypothetical protein
MMIAFDWQTVVVTLVALGAGAVVLRRLMPARKVQSKGADAPATPVSVACAHCATGQAALKPKPTARPVTRPAPRTETVPVVSVGDLRASAHQRRN